MPAVAVQTDQSYLRVAEAVEGLPQMSERVTLPDSISPRRGPIAVAAVVVTLMLAGTLALWAHYGTAIFFETIRAGFAACFG